MQSVEACLLCALRCFIVIDGFSQNKISEVGVIDPEI